jgi:hypothetical protein
MPHEPKFWVSVLLCVDLVAAGVALMWPDSRKIGIVMFGLGLAGLAGIFFLWPEAESPSANPTTSIKQNGTTINSPNVVGDSNTVNLSVPTESPSPLSLEFQGGAGMLPIMIAPHERLYVLALHPKITQDFGGATNNGNKPIRFPAGWPKRNALKAKSDPFEGDPFIWECEITNPNPESLLRIVLTFALTFRQPNAKGGSQATDPIYASHQHSVEIPDLKPQATFIFYVVNESPYFTVVQFPDRARADVVGRVGRVDIPIIQVGTNPIERMPAWGFGPSHRKWHSVSWGKGETN